MPKRPALPHPSPGGSRGARRPPGTRGGPTAAAWPPLSLAKRRPRATPAPRAAAAPPRARGCGVRRANLARRPPTPGISSEGAGPGSETPDPAVACPGQGGLHRAGSPAKIVVGREVRGAPLAAEHQHRPRRRRAAGQHARPGKAPPERRHDLHRIGEVLDHLEERDGKGRRTSHSKSVAVPSDRGEAASAQAGATSASDTSTPQARNPALSRALRNLPAPHPQSMTWAPRGACSPSHSHGEPLGGGETGRGHGKGQALELAGASAARHTGSRGRRGPGVCAPRPGMPQRTAGIVIRVDREHQPAGGAGGKAVPLPLLGDGPVARPAGHAALISLDTRSTSRGGLTWPSRGRSTPGVPSCASRARRARQRSSPSRPRDWRTKSKAARGGPTWMRTRHRSRRTPAKPAACIVLRSVASCEEQEVTGLGHLPPSRAREQGVEAPGVHGGHVEKRSRTQRSTQRRQVIPRPREVLDDVHREGSVEAQAGRQVRQAAVGGDSLAREELASEGLHRPHPRSLLAQRFEDLSPAGAELEDLQPGQVAEAEGALELEDVERGRAARSCPRFRPARVCGADQLSPYSAASSSAAGAGLRNRRPQARHLHTLTRDQRRATVPLHSGQRHSRRWLTADLSSTFPRLSACGRPSSPVSRWLLWWPFARPFTDCACTGAATSTSPAPFWSAITRSASTPPSSPRRSGPGGPISRRWSAPSRSRRSAA